MSYRIVMAFFQDDPELMPTLIAACDEYTEEAWGGTPDFFTDEIKKYDGAKVREMVVELPADAVEALFKVPVVGGSIPAGR